MGAFKNEKNGTWYVQFRYTDWCERSATQLMGSLLLDY